MKHFAYYVHVDSALLSKTKLCFSEQLPNIVHSTNLSTTIFRDGSTLLKTSKENRRSSKRVSIQLSELV